MTLADRLNRIINEQQISNEDFAAIAESYQILLDGGIITE